MANWELSPLYRHSTSSFISSTRSILSSHSSKLILRDSTTLQIIRTWSLLSSSSTKDSQLQFIISPSSQPHILAYTHNHSIAWVIDPQQDEPIAKLSIGGEESIGFDWTPDGSSFLSWSAHRLRISIFSLSQQPELTRYIQSPKCTIKEGGYSFSREGYFALLERHGNRDCIAIYDTKDWNLLRNVVIQDPTSDLVGIKWSPDGKYFVTWSSITNYYLHVFTLDGRKISTYSPYPSLTPSTSTPSISSPTETSSLSSKEQSRLKKSMSTYVGLGIRTIEWSLNGEFLAIGGYDGKVRVLSRVAGAFGYAVSELTCPSKTIGGKKERTVVWKEPNKGWIENTLGKGIVPFDSISTPHNLNQTPQSIDPSKPNPRIGISRIVWSDDSKWLCVLNQSFPSNLYIFSFLTSSSSTSNEPSLHLRPSLHTLILLNNPIKTFSFQGPPSSHSSSILTILTGDQSFILWTSPLPSRHDDEEEGNLGLTEGVGIPVPVASKEGGKDEAGGGFKPNQVSFGFGEREGEGQGEGRVMLLSEKGGMFCCAYPVD
ncbi:hypothetical protein JCM5353_006730 [Sporobolomyces roseus]